MYTSSIEFKNDLKNYKFYERKIEAQKTLLSKFEYLLYEKVSNPMDYDVIGYQGKEPIRIIKQKTPIAEEHKLEIREKLENERDRINAIIEKYKLKISTIDKTLNMLEADVKDMCIMIYVEGKSFDYVAKLYGMSKTSLYRYINKELSFMDTN